MVFVCPGSWRVDGVALLPLLDRDCLVRRDSLSRFWYFDPAIRKRDTGRDSGTTDADRYHVQERPVVSHDTAGAGLVISFLDERRDQ